MPSRDYLVRQFEEMGYFLATLLRRILKMKEENQEELAETVVREELIQELKLDVDQIVMLDNQAFLSVVKEYFATEDQLEKLANILKVLGEGIGHSFTPSKANYLRKSYFLFSYLQESGSVFSYDRRIKLLELQEIMKLNGITCEHLREL
jgi:hypothetical protein